jgi:hypothetical protein
VIVLIQQRDGSEQWCMTDVVRIEETDDLEIVLISTDSEPVVVDRDRQRIDIVGVG